MFCKIGNADDGEYLQGRDNHQDQEDDVILHGQFEKEAEHVLDDPGEYKAERKKNLECIVQFGCCCCIQENEREQQACFAGQELMVFKSAQQKKDDQVQHQEKEGRDQRGFFHG